MGICISSSQVVLLVQKSRSENHCDKGHDPGDLWSPSWVWSVCGGGGEGGFFQEREKEDWGWERVRLKTSHLHGRLAQAGGARMCGYLDAHPQMHAAVGDGSRRLEAPR